MTYSDYYYKAENFYFRRKGKDAVAWRDLDQALRDVFVDMFYQGRLNPNRVKYFEKNDRSNVIRLIKGNRLLSGDEAGRNRIGYLLVEGA
ncbi:hypothetical protein [Erwinia sp. 198]|uniref:hypothetical protein n=1 Tax=Erwinia sp. 198 TaxID=2022746 RepID=UPI000F687D0A|nr:hypothetical protein [Erwinia sp. 198]RRZ89863.1 hypothetical protein EGK14_15310 [Erwinia sp. 198]